MRIRVLNPLRMQSRQSFRDQSLNMRNKIQVLTYTSGISVEGEATTSSDIAVDAVAVLTKTGAVALRPKGFGFFVAIRPDEALPSSPGSKASGVEPIVEADISLDNTSLTIPLRTPFFAISFFRSALAPSVTWAPVNNVTTEVRAHSRTLASWSSRHSTSWGR